MIDCGFLWVKLRPNVRAIQLVFIASLTVSTLLTACVGQSAEELSESAKIKLVGRDFAGALIDLKSALQMNPNMPEARLLLGIALLEQGSSDAAVVELTKAEELHVPEDQVAPALARALFASGKEKVVIQRFGDVKLSDARGRAELSATLALAYAFDNQFPKAQRIIDESLRSSDPNASSISSVLLAQARILTAQGRHDEALVYAQKTLDTDPLSGEAHLFRGRLLRLAKDDVEGAIASFVESAKDSRFLMAAKGELITLLVSKGRTAEAKSHLSDLKRANVKHPSVGYLSAVVAYDERRYAQADELVEQLLRYAPNSRQLLLLGGSTSLQLGNFVAAETRLGRLVQTTDNMPVARRLLAETYLKTGYPEKALEVLSPLVEASKSDPIALAQMGQAYLFLGNLPDAEYSFAQAAKVRPADAQIATALALAKLAKGQASEAFSELRSISSKDPGEVADLALINAHLRRMNFDSALEAVVSLENKTGANHGTWYLRGLILRAKGDVVGAKKALEQSLSSQPSFFASVSGLIDIDIAEKNFDDALRRLKIFLENQPKSSEARLAQARVLKLKGADAKTLIGVLDDAINVAPEDPGPRIAKLNVLTDAKDLKGAANVAQEALASIPNSPVMLDAAGRALANAGDEQQAIAVFGRLANLQPKSTRPHVLLADVYERKGEQQQVLASLSRALAVAPDSLAIQRRVVSLADRMKNFGPALKLASEMQKRHPELPHGYVFEGDLEFSRKSFQKAIEAYQLALSKGEPATATAKKLYLAQSSAGRDSVATASAENWIKRFPNDASFFEFLGSVSVAKKSFASAEKYYRRCVTIQPNNPVYLNNLAWVLAERGHPDALEFALRATSLAPRSPPFLDTLAKALTVAGKFDKAEEAFAAAVRGAPDQVEYRINYVQFLVDRKRFDVARRELELVEKSVLPKEASNTVEKLKLLIRDGKSSALQITQAVVA